MDFELLSDKDVPPQKPVPAMHTSVSRLLAEAQQIVQHNHRMIARYRYLTDLDVLSHRPSRHRAQKRPAG